MKTEEKTLIQKLAKIQQELKAPKNQYNKFGNYKYRNCEDILEALKPLLGECVLTISDEVVQIGDRYYVKARAEFADDGKVTISSIAYARESEDKKGMDSAQITGAASSYARKYALNGLFAIDDTQDADSKDNETVKKELPTQQRTSIFISEKQIKMIYALAGSLKISEEDLHSELERRYNVESVKELTKTQASEVIEAMQKKIESKFDEAVDQ